jgi:nucleoside-diphosphate-sugar epimerase
MRGFEAAVSGCEAVVHCAARVHVMADSSRDPLSEYRRVNVDGTLELAKVSAKSGVRRFVFLSSIKVNGEYTMPGLPFSVEDNPRPQDPYGISKREAEEGLLELSKKTGMEVVIIRPPLVYGPGVKANLHRLMVWVSKGYPMPFGSIENRRSLVSLDNLIDLVTVCLEHTKAAGQTFMVSDGEDFSTSELVVRFGEALGCPARVFPIPELMFRIALSAIGKGAAADKLLGSLQVDISYTRRVLGWIPPVSPADAIKKTAEHFLKLK